RGRFPRGQGMDGAIPSFGLSDFGQADVGDPRRSRRLVTLVDQLCRHPGGTWPDKLNRPADLRAFSPLMNPPQVTHPILLDSHADATQQRVLALGPGVVLYLHDATELDFTTKTALLEHLGQIGQGTRRGYICHNSLAVRADTGETLGLLSQILHHRADVPDHETGKQKRERDNRESRLWVHGAQASGPAPAGVRCVDVSDSLSDTFEYLSYEVNRGRSFVLRARENRRLEEPVAEQSYLFEAARALPAQAERVIRVIDSPQRRGRTTTVQIAWAPVQLALPGK